MLKTKILRAVSTVTLLVMNIWPLACVPGQEAVVADNGGKPAKNGENIRSNDKPKAPEASDHIEKILAHQTKRFKDLETILTKDAKYHVKFPGSSAEKHALGTGIAVRSWQSTDHTRMVKHIGDLIKDLETKFPNRIHFGMIGDYKLAGSDCNPTLANSEGLPGLQPDGTFWIHVWGANENNFNLPDQQAGTFGSGQASCFEKQRKGVFGISTMPSGEEQVLMAQDRLLSQY